MLKEDTHLVAVFFDYENIVYSLRNRFEQKANFEALTEKCREFGRVVEARVFADWGLSYFSSALLYALQSSGFDLIFVPTGSTQEGSPRKNISDLYMVIQIMETLYDRPEIDTYVLLTGDRDFMPLVNVLKRHGKRVIAIGVDGSSSYYLTQAVDDFFYYSEVEAIYEKMPRQPKGRPMHIYDALVQAVQTLSERNKAPTLTHLKQVMIELLGQFDEKQHKDASGRQFLKFKDFVLEAQKRGLVRLIMRDRHQEVALPNQPPSLAANDGESAEPESPRPAESGPVSPALDSALDLLVKAVCLAQKEGRSFRASSIRQRISRLDPEFRFQEVSDESGKPFGRFADFVQEAAGKGLVIVTGQGVQMEVRPAPGVTASLAEADFATAAAPVAVSELELRGILMDALRDYRSFPASFLSISSHAQRWLERNNVAVNETAVRTLLTEAVELDLLHQSLKPDGKRQYDLNEVEELVTRFSRPAQLLAAAESADSDRDESDLNDNGTGEPESDDTATTEPSAAQTTPVEGAAASMQTAAVPDLATVHATLVEVVTELQARKVEPTLSRVKIGLAEKLGTFDEQQYTDPNGQPFQKFKEFILDTQKQYGIVRLEMRGGTGRVLLPRERRKSADTPAEPVDDLQSEVSSADLAALIAEAPAVAPAAPAPAAPAAEDLSRLHRISNVEGRQLIVDALRSYNNYPAPFMGILAHCRDLRNERNYFIASGPLRDLLSETSRIGLIHPASGRNERPTRYAYREDAALVARYLGLEETGVEDSGAADDQLPQKSTTLQGDATESADQPREPEQPAVGRQEVAEPAAQHKVAGPETVSADELLARTLLVETLRAMGNEAAPFTRIQERAVARGAGQNIDIPHHVLRSSLTRAVREGVLSTAGLRGMRPVLYAFSNDENAVSVFLNVVTEQPVVLQYEEEVSPEEVAAEPQALPPTLLDLYETLVRAAEVLPGMGRTTTLASVKRKMEDDLRQDFDVTAYADPTGEPFTRFKDFAVAAEKLGLIAISRAGRMDYISAVDGARKRLAAGQILFELLPAEAEAAGEPPAEPVDPEALLPHLIELSARAVREAVAEVTSRRLPAIRARIMRLDDSFNIKLLYTGDNSPFANLGDLFREVQERGGLIRLAGSGIAMTVEPAEPAAEQVEEPEVAEVAIAESAETADVAEVEAEVEAEAPALDGMAEETVWQFSPDDQVGEEPVYSFPPDTE